MPSVAEPENAWAGQGAVLLDIGGDVGALVVDHARRRRSGIEVEIRPLDGQHAHHHGDHEHHGTTAHTHEHLAHVAVVARPVAEGRLPSLVFPASWSRAATSCSRRAARTTSCSPATSRVMQVAPPLAD